MVVLMFVTMLFSGCPVHWSITRKYCLRNAVHAFYQLRPVMTVGDRVTRLPKHKKAKHTSKKGQKAKHFTIVNLYIKR